VSKYVTVAKVKSDGKPDDFYLDSV